MKIFKIVVAVVLSLVLFVVGFYYFMLQSAKSSNDCEQFVIDSYEVYSGINIPEVDFINCYYEDSVRVSVYHPKEALNLQKFMPAKLGEALSVLKGRNLLSDNEKPSNSDLLLAKGRKWGKAWVYILDTASNILWAELSSGKQLSDIEIDIGAMINPLEDRGVFRDSSFYNWGSSIIKGDSGMYHLFYSRWPRKFTFYAWLTHSEIAHAVSENPAGPFQFKETILKGRADGSWDDITAHNPKIKKFDGKYYLYYISTNAGDLTVNENELIETSKTGYKHPNWSILRNNQRTGVAVATSVNGPWIRSDTPIVEPSGPITTLTVNPAVDRGPDNRFYLIVKGDKPNETRFIRNQAISISDNPKGPFKIQGNPVIDDLDTEDVSMWFSKSSNRFYAVFHAHTFIGMMESSDGLNWQKAANYSIMDKNIVRNDGTVLQPDRMERPFIFVEEGLPRVLSLAVKMGDDSFSVFLDLQGH